MTNFKLKTIQTSILTAAVVALSAPAWAANQGSLSATSSGDLTISMTTEDQIQISNLEDIALADSGSGDFAGASPACIYRNGTGSYTLTASGSGDANAFTISDGGANNLSYDITYDDGTGAQALAAGNALAGRTNADTASKTCAGGNNGSISINIAAADVSAVPAGTYTGSLTLTVSPE